MHVNFAKAAVLLLLAVVTGTFNVVASAGEIKTGTYKGKAALTYQGLRSTRERIDIIVETIDRQGKVRAEVHFSAWRGKLTGRTSRTGTLRLKGKLLLKLPFGNAKEYNCILKAKVNGDDVLKGTFEVETADAAARNPIDGDFTAQLQED
jgi:hypothetical protein